MSKDIEGRSGMTDVVRNSKIALEGHREAMHSHPGYRRDSFRPRTSAGLLPEFRPCARSRLRTPSPPLCPKVRVWVFKPLPTPSRGRESTLVWRKSRGLVRVRDRSKEEASAKPVDTAGARKWPECAAHGELEEGQLWKERGGPRAKSSQNRDRHQDRDHRRALQ